MLPDGGRLEPKPQFAAVYRRGKDPVKLITSVMSSSLCAFREIENPEQ